VYGPGDNITVTFSEPTNRGGGGSASDVVATKRDVDKLVLASQSLGTAYSGRWVGNAVFVILIEDIRNGFFDVTICVKFIKISNKSIHS
jgi:hypothetical protein